MKGWAGAALLLLLPLLTGCWSLKEPEELGIVAAMGVDALSGGGYRVTLEVAHPSGLSKAAGGTGGGGKTASAYYLSEDAPTVYQALKRMPHVLARQVFWSQTRVLIVGEPLAKRNLLDAVDLLARGEQTRLEMPVVVGRPTAAAVLHLKPLGESLIGNAIVTQMHNAARVAAYRATSLNDVLEAAPEEGIDPLLPLVGNQLGYPAVLGSALLRGGRMVDTATPAESTGILWLRGEIRPGAELSVPFSDTGGRTGNLGLTVTGAQVRIGGDPAQGSPLSARLEVKAEVMEADVTGFALTPTNLMQMDRAIARRVLGQVEKGLAAIARSRSDPVGFGRYLHRFHPASWRQVKATWYRHLNRLPVRVNVSPEVSRSHMTTGTPGIWPGKTRGI